MGLANCIPGMAGLGAALMRDGSCHPVFAPGMAGLVPGMAGLGASAELQLTLAAAQAVHMDVASGRSLEQADADLARAYDFLSSVPPEDQAAGVDAVASARRDRDNLAAHQSGAQSAAADLDAASSQRVTTAIDTGSGSGVFYDTVAGTVGSDNLNKMLNSVPGQPGAGDQARCLATGGTWNPQAQSCSGGASTCSVLPQPIRWACEHPRTAAAIVIAPVALYYGGGILRAIGNLAERMTR